MGKVPCSASLKATTSLRDSNRIHCAEYVPRGTYLVPIIILILGLTTALLHYAWYSAVLYTNRFVKATGKDAKPESNAVLQMGAQMLRSLHPKRMVVIRVKCVPWRRNKLHAKGTSGGYRGGQTRPMPPLTNKDTPPVHCNEFNYMSSATHCRSSCRPRPVVRVKYHP